MAKILKPVRIVISLDRSCVYVDDKLLSGVESIKATSSIHKSPEVVISFMKNSPIRFLPKSVVIEGEAEVKEEMG
jgi:hypothetical protein